jgi:hypothetical protein
MDELYTENQGVERAYAPSTPWLSAFLIYGKIIACTLEAARCP